MIVLLAALLLVYVIFFDVHGDTLTPPNTLQTTQNLASWSDIDRMVYIDRTRQLSNNPYSDDIYYDTSLDPRSVAFADPKTVAQVQDPVKDPIIVPNGSTSNIAQWWNSLPDVVEDLQGRRFYSTDFLFGRTDTDDATNVGTEANPVWALASRTGQIDPQVVVTTPVPTAPATTTTTTTTVAPAPNNWQILLDNTRVWDKSMPLMQTLQLWTDVEYVLKDVHNTHYVYLGKYTGDITQIVSFQWGTSVDITNEINIQSNHLFWEKITKISLPNYKNNLKELMLVEFLNGDRRFIQIDKDWYSTVANKVEINEKFDEWY